MNDKISALNATKRKLQTASLVFVICGILCIAMLMKQPRLSAVFLAAMLLAYVFGFRRQVKRYRQRERQAMLEEGLRSCFKEITYQEKDGLSQADILDAHFLPAETSQKILIRETVTGFYQRMPAAMTDITTCYQILPGSGKKQVNFLSGCYFQIRLSRCTGSSFQLWPQDMLSEQVFAHYLPGYHSCPAPAGLKKNFSCYIPDGAPEPVLSEDAEKAILRLQEYTPGRLALQLDGSCLRIFIQSRFMCTRQLPAKVDITPQMLSENPMPEAPYMLRVADALNQ